MKKPSPHGQPFDLNDAFGGVLDTITKIGFWAGAAGTLFSVIFLVVAMVYAQPGEAAATVGAQAQHNIDMLSKVLLASVIVGGFASAYRFWGEETLLGVIITVSVAMIFAPAYVPVLTGKEVSPIGAAALGAIAQGGLILGAISFVVLIAEIAIRVTNRSKKGAKTDALKYGKGVKEEKGYQNRFMGKCWQLPYCRQFVRERCPIYHARRTCWKEKVGCMCEEEVIRNAMENRVIPKDALAAAKFIPVNNKLTFIQKKERCRQCVIFNEHLKHRYRLFLPITLVGFVLIYIALRQPLLGMMDHMIRAIDLAMGKLTMGNAPNMEGQLKQGALPLKEILLDCTMVVLLAYALKGLEFVIFKLKV